MYKNGRVDIIANDQGNRITPSYVAFTPDGERLIGDAAKNQLTSNPENTVFDAKRLIGRTWDDPMVQKDIKYWPFMTKMKNNKPHVQVVVKGENKLFAPEEISAMVLIKMKVCVQLILHVHVLTLVIVPLCLPPVGNSRGIPGARGHPCCRDCACLLQRRPATSHQRRWNHCWTQCHENHQRTVREGERGGGRESERVRERERGNVALQLHQQLYRPPQYAV